MVPTPIGNNQQTNDGAASGYGASVAKCRRDVKCNRPRCAFKHSTAKCRFNEKCTRPRCTYRHSKQVPVQVPVQVQEPCRVVDVSEDSDEDDTGAATLAEYEDALYLAWHADHGMVAGCTSQLLYFIHNEGVNAAHAHSGTGITALMVAAAKGQTDTCMSLIAAGARIGAAAKGKPMTAQDLARHFGFAETAEAIDAYSQSQRQSPAQVRVQKPKVVTGKACSQTQTQTQKRRQKRTPKPKLKQASQAVRRAQKEASSSSVDSSVSSLASSPAVVRKTGVVKPTAAAVDGVSRKTSRSASKVIYCSHESCLTSLRSFQNVQAVHAHANAVHG